MHDVDRNITKIKFVHVMQFIQLVGLPQKSINAGLCFELYFPADRL